MALEPTVGVAVYVLRRAPERHTEVLLLRDARVVSNGPIAIHFSRESEHASMVLNQLTTRKNAEESVIQILNVLGRDYRYVSSKQIVAGRFGQVWW